MSAFFEKLSSRMLESDGYRDASNQLFHSYVDKIIGLQPQLERRYVKQLISVAQVLYQLDSPNFRKEGAALLSMLIDVCGNHYPEIVGIANAVFAKSGDFPNITLIKRTFPDLSFRYSFYNEAEIDFREQLNTVEELDFPLTNFQRSLWENLTSDEDVITVAPTSAGKTHIILTYLTRKLIESDGSFAAVIVPTRALISEVASKLYEISNEHEFGSEIEICTVPGEKSYAEKTFFVMTQERLFDVLQSGDISFNYLFIDEAHNITDDSRGVLLHLTIEKLLEDSLPQIIVSMPSPSFQDSFSTVFEDVQFTKEITSNSPVAKIVMEVQAVGRDLVLNRLNTTDALTIPKGFTGKKLSDIVYKFGKGQSNIIYRNQTDHCESIATEIANKVSTVPENQELEEAADYVAEFIHEDFTLAETLRKGVAFHYGPLPGSLRLMIERLVKENHVQFIACTSTLAEGVNLPAKNLFLNNPIQPIYMQPSERLDDVKINNITGRAGRMLEHFAGNIFLVDPKSWQVQDYFEEKEDPEEKVPTYFKALNEELGLVIAALQGNYPHDAKEHYKFYTIANKLIKEYAAGKLQKTMEAPELLLDEKSRALLTSNIENAYRSLKVAPITLEANPTIGYIQQNKLFAFLSNTNDLSKWTLPHPKSRELYDKLLQVSEQLQQFGVYTPSGEYSIAYMCTIAVKWIRGDSLKSIISEQIKWSEDNEGNTNANKAVRDVIKVINNDIRFRMANALRCYHILLSNVLALKNLDFSSAKLYSFIEIGACDERMIALVNLGVSREAAKEINDILSQSIRISSLSDLINLFNGTLLNNLHPVSKKEVESLIGITKR